MDDLLAEFVAETREMLQVCESEIVAWETEPTDRARLDAIFRFVHTVKGNCGFFDFPQLERLSHAAESALAEVRAGNRRADAALVSTVLAVIDRIAEMVDAIEAGDAIADRDDRALIAQLAGGTPEPGEADSSAQPANGSRADPASSGQRTIRLPVDLLDRVMNGMSDLVLARNDLARRFHAADVQPELGGPFERLSSILVEVRDAVSRMRMQRIEPLFNAIPRMVRDLSAELGKQVTVTIDGNGVELDREMIELVRDPLMHIIRNAIGHGIEMPAHRRTAGKREAGLLGVSASQSGNRITLRISDDGRGLDLERIGEKALTQGIVTEAELARMDDSQKLDLIFRPGLSTAEAVDAISGRGVGLDVVRANVERMGGAIEVSSEPGKGTVFTVILPLTLSIIGGLTIDCAGQKYAIHRSYVDEIADCRSNAIAFAEVGDATLIDFRGERIRYIALHDVLGISKEGSAVDLPALVILRLANGERFALGVNGVHDHEDLVIKPVTPEIAAAELYAGVTLLEDGQPVLLLDISRIALKLQLTSGHLEPGNLGDEASPAREAVDSRKLMLFDRLDGRRHAMPMELVRRIDTVDASAVSIDEGRAQVVIDDAIFALTGHERGAVPGDKLILLRLSDGIATLLYAVSQVADAIDLSEPLAPAQADPSIEGMALIDGQAIPVVDGYWLFSAHHGLGVDEDAPICRLPADNDWARTILAPLVRAAGFRVTQDRNADAAVAFAFAEESEDGREPQANNVIVLRKARDASAGSIADSIYRYDRNAILAALASRHRGGAA